MKKYAFFDGDAKQVGNVVLQRIISTRQLTLADGTVLKQGTLGGYIQSEKNLSHEGHCWVADEAIVSGKAIVSGNALVKDQATVCGRARVEGSAIVSGRSKLSDCAKALNNAVVHNQDLNGIDVLIGPAVREHLAPYNARDPLLLHGDDFESRFGLNEQSIY